MKNVWNPGVLIVSVMACALSGCTAGRMYEIGPETHFVYPNSNVRMLGPVSYTYKSPVSFGIPKTLMTGKEDLEFYNAALAQIPGSNLIADYVRVTEFKYFMIYPPIIFYWTQFTLQGTAAKMTVGDQELGGETVGGRPRAESPAEKPVREAEISKAAKVEKAVVATPAGRSESAPPAKKE